MWIEYQPNPRGHRVGDCTVRAISKALDVDWDTAYCMTSAEGFEEKDMPSSDAVWGTVLRKHGFQREAIKADCKDCYTAEDFCRDHPIGGTYALAFGGHVAVVKDGKLYDSWDSSQLSPQYFYYRKDE